MPDKRLYELMERGVNAADKIGNALEAMLEDAKVQMESTPPKCPHCNDVNPIISLAPRDTIQGSLVGLMEEATCMKCNHTFYVIFTGWAICKDKQEAMTNGHLIVEEVMGSAARRN